MGYEVFKKVAPRKRRAHVDRPLLVSLDKSGRLKLNQGFYNTMIQQDFKKAEILIDYDKKKIALKMLKEDEACTSEVKKLIAQPRRTRVAFLSFVKVRNALKLSFPFVRNATWDEKTKLVEFTWKEEPHA